MRLNRTQRRRAAAVLAAVVIVAGFILRSRTQDQGRREAAELQSEAAARYGATGASLGTEPISDDGSFDESSEEGAKTSGAAKLSATASIGRGAGVLTPEAPGGFRALALGGVGDAEGKPVAGATLTLYAGREPGGVGVYFDRRGEVFSREDGSYSMRLKRPFEGWLLVDKTGYERLERSVDLTEPGEAVNDFVVLEAADLVWGRVREAGSGRPLEGVQVILTFSRYSPRPTGQVYERMTHTDRRGEFSFTRVRINDTFYVQFGIRSHLFEMVKHVFEHGETKKWFDVELEPAKILSVKVVDSTGRPVPEARVSSPVMPFPGFTGEEGIVEIQVDEERSEPVECTVLAAGHEDQKFTLDLRFPWKRIVLQPSEESEGYEVGGLVIDYQGQPVADTRILFGSGGSQRVELSSGTTDWEGRFRLRVPKMPVRSVSASHPDYLSTRVEFQPAVHQREFTITLLGGDGVIRGRVLTSEGRPSTHFRIAANRQEPESQHPASRLKRTVSDPEGRFLLPGLPAGRYNLWVESVHPNVRELESSRIRSIELGPGEVRDDVIIQLRRHLPDHFGH